MHAHSILSQMFAAENLIIAAGYAAIPILVLPYLPLTRRVLIFGAGFLLGCAGTHLWMAVAGHPQVGWFWLAEHAVQAVCTWGFILTFHQMLRRATSRRRNQPTRSAATGEAYGRDQEQL